MTTDRDEWLGDIRRAIRTYAHACQHDISSVPQAAAEIEALLAGHSADEAESAKLVGRVVNLRDVDGDLFAGVRWVGQPPESGTDLYTHPATSASKEAVTLSDDEIVDYWLNTPRGVGSHKYHGVLVFARAIRAHRVTSRVESPTTPLVSALAWDWRDTGPLETSEGDAT